MQSSRSKRRWAKERAKGGSLECPATAGKTVPVIPRTQETRTAEVFGPPPTVTITGKVPRGSDIWKRVHRRLKAETDAPAGYWNRKQRQYGLTLEEVAKDYAANGQIKEFAQIHLVLYSKTKEMAVAETAQLPSGLSPEEDARIRAEVEAMSTRNWPATINSSDFADTLADRAETPSRRICIDGGTNWRALPSLRVCRGFQETLRQRALWHYSHRTPLNLYIAIN